MQNKHLMPSARQDRPRTDVQFDLSPQALERWSRNLTAAKAEDEAATISIFDPIGVQDFFSPDAGVTAKRIAGVLRNVGERDVNVLINSPGGDLFEGMAIYNLLREHSGKVTVKVLGLAASAASIIAMAGDEIQIARAGFLMVHNTWVVVMGNRNDLQEVSEQLEPFDIAMAEIYAARTGLDTKQIMKKMDAETWINGSAAVDEGWADELLPADQVKKSAAIAERPAAYALDVALAKTGMPRSERRALLQEYRASKPSAAGPNGTPRAAEDDTPCAVVETAKLLKSFSITA
jgi:ATP-dependent Clp protease protease subunit